MVAIYLMGRRVIVDRNGKGWVVFFRLFVDALDIGEGGIALGGVILVLELLWEWWLMMVGKRWGWREDRGKEKAKTLFILRLGEMGNVLRGWREGGGLGEGVRRVFGKRNDEFRFLDMDNVRMSVSVVKF
jgi:hypothetical protein